MKKFTFSFYRAVGYIGLYADIFSASCRWLVSAPRGWRAPYKTFVTRALKASGYIRPTLVEVEAAQEQRRINSEQEHLTWIAKQPETIQTCLKYDPVLLEKAYRSHPGRPERYSEGLASVTAIPKFVNLPEDGEDKMELDEDGYLRKKL